jgi:hypothetical protein
VGFPSCSSYNAHSAWRWSLFSWFHTAVSRALSSLLPQLSDTPGSKYYPNHPLTHYLFFATSLPTLHLPEVTARRSDYLPLKLSKPWWCLQSMLV